MLLLNGTGDNLLTAVNVARDCEMLPLGERVILVTASPPSADSALSIKYSLAEMYEADSDVGRRGQDHLDESEVFSASCESDPMFTDSWPDSIFRPMENSRISRLLPQSKMHFALCGSTLDVIRKHCPELLPKILCRGTVFARMSPDQKTKVNINIS